MSSPELTGGDGFTYEDAVTAHYLAAMVSGATATAFDGRIVRWHRGHVFIYDILYLVRGPPLRLFAGSGQPA